MSLLSTSTELIFANTTVRPGTIVLPDTFQTPGRILTIKDLSGAWGRNRLTITTNRNNQTLDGGSFSTFLTTAGGWTTLIAGDNQKWYTIGGTQLHTITTSTIQSSAANIQSLSTGMINISTLTLMDNRSASTNTLYAVSSLLYYSLPNNQSSIVAGTRQATGRSLLPMRRPFQPNDIAGLGLWLDAADINTIRIINNSVSQWRDKSANRRLASSPFLANNPLYVTNSAVRTGLPAVRFSNSASINQYMLITPFFQMAQAQALTIFVVYNCREASYNATFGAYLLAHPGFDCGFVLNYTFSTLPNIYATYYNNANTQFTAQSISISYNTPYVVSVGFSNIVGTGIRSYVSVNGNTTTTHTNASATELNTNRASLNLGGTGGNGNNIDISEVLYYPTLLNATDTQRVEGYLAWKWGLVGNLPSSHLYKTTMP